MKKFLLLFCSLFLMVYTSEAQSPSPKPATAIVKNACHEALQQHKKVFIIFHASWCGWCRRMDSIMHSADCKKLFDGHYVIRHIDVMESPDKKNLENPGGKDMLKKYHGDQQGIPYWLILDGHGKLLADSRISLLEQALPAVITIVVVLQNRMKWLILFVC